MLCIKYVPTIYTYIVYIKYIYIYILLYHTLCTRVRTLLQPRRRRYVYNVEKYISRDVVYSAKSAGELLYHIDLARLHPSHATTYPCDKPTGYWLLHYYIIIIHYTYYRI